jgi:hypothetical protein
MRAVLLSTVTLAMDLAESGLVDLETLAMDLVESALSRKPFPRQRQHRKHKERPWNIVPGPLCLKL